ncbi:MAG: hydroxymyristoyl-ACP dehydratase [Bacteroidales bacterium]|nr:hydroxymyristoyl-ACP dehydratase [Bacteroidales bacterium]
MFPVNAAPYIPQQPPIIMVDSFLECNDALIITTFRIPENHIFVQDGHLTAAGVIENIAQSCAARIGWINRNKPVKIGMIGSVSNLEISFLPASGESLNTKVEILSEIFNATVMQAEIQCNGKQVAQCGMKVFLSDQNVLRKS